MARWLATGLMAAAAAGCAHPRPTTAVFILDGSRSALPIRAEAIHTIRNVSDALDPAFDRLVVYRMGAKVWNVYVGPAKPRELPKLLAEYADSPPEESGTAYGQGILRGLGDVEAAIGRGEQACLVVLGDGADEHVSDGGNVNWESLPQRLSKLPAKDVVFGLCFIHPQWADRFKQAVESHFGEKLLILPPELAVDGKAARRIREKLQK